MVDHHDLFSTLDEDSEVTSYLNHAALAKVRSQEKLGHIRELPNSSVISMCLTVARKILGVAEEQKVFLARNATEAYGISIDYLSRRSEDTLVSLPRDHYVSIHRATTHFFNYGEKDSQTTYSTVEEAYQVQEKRTLNRVITYDQSEKGLENHILDYQPDIIVFNHTNRVNGREEDASKFAKLVKGIASSISPNYRPYILSDSAQTLTTTNKFSVQGVDFQIGCFHKGLGSFHPLGFGITSSEEFVDLVNHLSLNPNPYFPSRHTFEEYDFQKAGLGTVEMESFYCFLETVNYLSSRGLVSGIDLNDLEQVSSTEDISFENLIEYRRKLYKEAYIRLRDTRGIEVTSDFPTISSGYILSFKLSRMLNLSAAGFSRALKDAGVYVTYISETDELRISFGPDNTKVDIDNLLSLIQQYL